MLFNRSSHPSVYADGSTDARDGTELSIQQKFFDIQKSDIKTFFLKLNVTNPVDQESGRRSTQV